MTRAATPLRALTDCLRGEPAAVADWGPVLALANRTWLTPALYCALAGSGRLDDLPAEARGYLDFIHARNRERNLRLRDQLLEAVAALNRVEIDPTLLKGAIGLFTASDAGIGRRMMSDIDLGVQACELAAATACLAALGYEDLASARGMARPEDAAMLELRPHAPFSPAGARLPHRHHPALVACGPARAWVPSPTSRALHWIRHDMIKEGDYWRGRIDLRHLHDLAQLAGTGEGIDWSTLRAIMSDKFERNALETQLLMLQHLFGSEVPPPLAYRPIIRFRHWQRLFAAKHPVAGVPLRLAGNLAWGWRRMTMAEGLSWRGVFDFARRATRALLGTNTGPRI